MHSYFGQLLFGPNFINTKVWIQPNENKIARISSYGLKEGDTETLLTISCPAITAATLASLRAHFHNDPFDAHRCNLQAVERLSQLCGAPLDLGYVLVSAGVILAVGSHETIRTMWEEQDTEANDCTTYRCLNSKAVMADMVENMLPLDYSSVSTRNVH